MNNIPKDISGFPIEVGMKVARAMLRGRSAVLEIQVVTKVDNDKGHIYLDGRHVPIQYPRRSCKIIQ